MQELLQAGNRHHQAGRFAEAEAAYRKALALSPGLPVALHLLGLVAHQTGRAELAREYLAKSVAGQASPAEFHLNYGNFLRETGDVAGALRQYELAIHRRPDYPEAFNNLGGMLSRLGRFREAAAMFRQASRQRPGWADATYNLAHALKALGLTAQFEGSFTEAIGLLEEASRCLPRSAEIHAARAVVLSQADRAAEAEAAARLAIECDAASADAHAALGYCARSGEHYADAIRISPRFTDARLIEGQVAVAAEWLREAAELNPANLPTLAECAQALARFDAGDDAAGAFGRVLEARPGTPSPAWVLGNRLLSLHYKMERSREAIFREHVRVGAMIERRPPMQLKALDLSPERKLRIGYVSPDFRSHAVAYFIENILEHHDRAEFEVFCYSAGAEDEVTGRLRSHAHQWRSIRELDDGQAARLIADDRIDILIDLAGHTAGNRLGVFALKPAPVQATYLGYPDTTGLRSIDWRISDDVADPSPEADAFCTERLARLGRCAWCYRAPASAPAVRQEFGEGAVTFGCFNNLHKLNGQTFHWWARILEQSPGSRLLLKARGLDEPASRKRISDLAGANGIDAGRIELLGPTRFVGEHLATYHRVDIALDSFPYNGTTTTCEALWMGVPVITLAGARHSSRVGASLLLAVGLEELVAESPERYVKAAVRLAGDVTRRATLLRELRDRLRRTLADGAGFVREIESVYRKIWRQRCENR